MEKMLVVVIDSEDKAAAARTVLASLEEEKRLMVFDDVVITKSTDGTATVKHGNQQVPAGEPPAGATGNRMGVLGRARDLGITRARFLTGLVPDLSDSVVGVDFIDDVLRELNPGKFALVADVDEVWETPLDVCMEALGGTVYRRSMSELRRTFCKHELAAMRTDLAELRAEHAAARAERKPKLVERIRQLDAKIETLLQRDKKTRQAAARVEKDKPEAGKAKAAPPAPAAIHR